MDPMKSAGWIFAVGVGGTIAASAVAPEQQPKAPVAQTQVIKPPAFLDYLIQDVCVDGEQRVVNGDPAVCATHRNVELGEKIPFVVTDFDHASQISLSAVSSVPVRSKDGAIMVLVSKGLEGRYTPDYKFSFSRERDAFDLIDISNSQYASIVRTFDGGCFDQIFSRNGKAAGMANRAGGWILFPRSSSAAELPENGSVRLKTYRMQVSPGLPQCANNEATGMSFWAKPARYTFETGKTLSALRTEHFAAADLTDPVNSFERFYFTREYGMTRWESWWTVAHCHATLGRESPRCGQTPGNPLRTRCDKLKLPSNQTSGLEQWGGQGWVRMDCRDTTRYVPLAQPQLPLSPEMGRGDGLIDIDYAATVSGR